MARKPSPKPKHVAHTNTGQKFERRAGKPNPNPASATPLAEMDRLRAAFDAATVPYIPAPIPHEATRVGRPSNYKPEYAQTVLDDAALGHTLGATCAVIGCSRQTLLEWAASHPEMGDAIARAKQIRQRFYEGHVIDIARRGGDSTRMSAIKLGLLNVGGEDWKERLTAEHNVTFSLAGLIDESMKLAPKVIEGQLIEQPKADGSDPQD